MKSIRGLLPFVRKAGELAVERQHSVLRAFKSDGSVLTQVDRDIDKFLTDSIVSLFPEAVVISEENNPGESASQGLGDASFIFAVDPIDGTDCFSQGMPGWAISIGLLDRSLKPVAGIVYAPKWGGEPTGGVLLFADIGKGALLNEEEIPQLDEDFNGDPQVFAGSSVHKRYRMDSFPGKIRNAGSTVIHIVAPLLHRAVVGTIFSPNYIWDIAGAHATILAQGLTMEYLDSRPLDYRRLVHRERAEGAIVAGTRKGIELIRSSFQRL
ncbi:MAG TPA: inositol monophosphatase family protein [Spirochaetia bacterium]|nr:inositol monophosphatase family protein [Spirochaetia bacterium]